MPERTAKLARRARRRSGVLSSSALALPSQDQELDPSLRWDDDPLLIIPAPMRTTMGTLRVIGAWVLLLR